MVEQNTASNQQSFNNDGEMDVRELALILWNQKRTIVIITLCVAIVALITSLRLPSIYRAETLLSPAATENDAQFSSQFGFAANLAGVNIGQANNKKAKALATVISREFARKFVSDHDLLPWLFASDYSVGDQQSIINAELYNEADKTWHRNRTPTMPSSGEVYEKFSDILSVSEDQSTGLVAISIEWFDPALAADWVNWLVVDVNQHIKARDKDEAQLAIDYLQEQLKSTQLVGMQRVFYQLIEAQTRTLMLADIKDDYVFEVIDQAVTPEKKSKPRRSLIVILATLIGFMLAVLYVLASHNYHNKYE